MKPTRFIMLFMVICCAMNLRAATEYNNGTLRYTINSDNAGVTVTGLYNTLAIRFKITDAGLYISSGNLAGRYLPVTAAAC